VLRIIPPDLPQAVAAPRRGSTASRSTTSSEQHVRLDRVQPRTLSTPLAGCPPPTRCLFARVAHYSTLVTKYFPMLQCDRPANQKLVAVGGELSSVISSASGPQPHPSSIELFCPAPFSGGDRAVAGAGEDGGGENLVPSRRDRASGNRRVGRRDPNPPLASEPVVCRDQHCAISITIGMVQKKAEN
jgi:hypothetical protein